MNVQDKTADLLYRAVRRSAVLPTDIEQGDLIVVTEDNSDTVGIVHSLEQKESSINVTLKTVFGFRALRVSNMNFIHVIQKAAMLDLRKHNQYERTNEESNKEKDMIKENKGHKERPEFYVDHSEKSVLPTSKISLSLRKTTKES